MGRTRNRPAPPAHKQAMTFCIHHLGKGCFAPHTGYDWPAWVAWVYLLEAYARGDDRGRTACIAAMRALLGGVQRTADIHVTFAQAIPAVLDWSDAHRLWPQVGGMTGIVVLDRWTRLLDDGRELACLTEYPL